jgi:hypothetical protein
MGQAINRLGKVKAAVVCIVRGGVFIYSKFI